jgi:hypothetical protein
MLIFIEIQAPKTNDYNTYRLNIAYDNIVLWIFKIIWKYYSNKINLQIVEQHLEFIFKYIF